MPELPEVETVVRALRKPLIGRTITGVWSDWPKQIITPPLPELAARITGCRVESIDRRGKYLLFSLSEGETLIIHLKMTGHLAVVDDATPTDPWVHTAFPLDDGRTLRFRDMRKFGRVYLVRDPDDIIGPLGPEPLDDDFTVDILRQRLAGRKRVLKPLLLDQTFIAGVGNIYADESLFRARLLPTRRSDTLTEEEIAQLHEAIRHVLQLGIDREGASITNYVKPDGEKGDMQNEVMVFRRTGYACYVCGAPVERMVLGGRSTHYCASCQV